MGLVVPFEPSRMPKRRPAPAPLPKAVAEIIILPVVQHVRPKPVPAEPRAAEQVPAQQPS